ncbi:MAG: hypothetical protein CMQ93_00010 [Gammaproteobacteria bacterium]|nr:hypothetical protein [Gammaproteobacteria bacterium]|tara:strand:+ start:440 stop:619 length:180 start_codon:yes stop_codon:yes gene_type:complete
MNQKYNISDILDAVNEINNSKTFKKIKDPTVQKSKEILNKDIPPSTLKLIEEAEKNIKN